MYTRLPTQLFDAARHPPRQLGSAGRLLLPTDNDDGNDKDSDNARPLALHSLRVNADGSWISLLAHPPGRTRQQPEGEKEGPAPTALYLYDVDRDAVVPYHNFIGEAAGAVAVTDHVWDARDPRLLACELQGLAAAAAAARGAEGNEEEGQGREVATLFVAAAAEEGKGGRQGSPLVLLDRFPLQRPLHGLVSMSVPRLYLTGVNGQLLRRTMRAFVGLNYDGLDDGECYMVTHAI